MNGSSPPLARGWRMSGGRLDDPEVVNGLVDEMTTRVNTMPGCLGFMAVLNRHQRDLRGISFWETEQSRAASTAGIHRAMKAAHQRLGVQFDGPWDYRVLYSRFHNPAVRVPNPRIVQHLAVRIGRLTGPGAADPDLWDLLRQHCETAVAPSPGCVGALLLADASRPAIIWVSFWFDAATEERSRPLFREVLTSLEQVVAEAVPIDGDHEVVVCYPMQRLVR